MSALIPPDEQSIRSTPNGSRIFASSLFSLVSHPPSIQSWDEVRRNSGIPAGITLLITSTTSSKNRIRFSKLPPYSSLRLFETGDKNEWIK